MTERFYDLHDAVAHAATITSKWTDENGNEFDLEQMTEYLEIGESESGIDHTDDTEFYYLVSDDGSVGLTSDAEQSIYWAMYGQQSAPQQPQQGAYAGTFCTECGNPLADNAAFCPHCGTKRAVSAQGPVRPAAPAREPAAPKPSPKAKPKASRFANPAPPRLKTRVGFSDVPNSLEFQEAARRQRKSVRGCLMAFIFAPLVLCPLIGYFGDDAFTAGLYVGVALSLIFFVFYTVLNLYENSKKPWEGVVEKQRESESIDRDRDGNERGKIYNYYTIVRTDKGRKKTIHEVVKSRNSGNSTPNAYNYFHVGDRIRFFGGKLGLNFPYEKYDKSSDRYQICPVCATHNDLDTDHCKKCDCPLL